MPLRLLVCAAALVGCGSVSKIHVDGGDEDASRADAAADACVVDHSSVTFIPTGAVQMFSVPSCVTALAIDAYGAGGGSGGGVAGKGGHATGTATVTPGETLYLFVGQAGTTVGTTGIAAGTPGGFNGGGAVDEYIGWTSQAEGVSGTGGGATDVRQGGMDLTDRIIVAGGGGGGATANVIGGPPALLDGGDAGGTAGAPGTATTAITTSVAGGGASQTAGGTAGSCCTNYPDKAGTLGIGGDTYRDASGSGGGGGGYYGGGAGQFAGGGGGSSYTGNLVQASSTGGVQVGDGKLTLSW
ncbi:MAG TPA: glycine-rich protein [Kofleriaceae bacterium]|nr:glycine-rich protein [Kofleriaceae bacterium]